MAVVAIGSSASAAGPIESNPTVDAARQGLASFLAAQPAADDDSDLELGGCPVLAESDLASPLSFFGPVGTFDAYRGQIAVEYGVDDSVQLLGVTCEAERSVASQGGVLDTGIGVWDFAGTGEMLSAINAMPLTAGGDDDDLLGGSMHGYCESEPDLFACYQFWTFDGVVVGTYVGFEDEESQKDPLMAVGQILSAQLPTLLANAAALTSAPAGPSTDSASTTFVPIGGKV